MYLADFDYSITYIHGEENTAADTLSRMPDAAPDACLAACAIAYTRNPPNLPIAGVLNIAADHSLLDTIVNGYKTDDFAKQDLKVRELLYNLAHDTWGTLASIRATSPSTGPTTGPTCDAT
jgi:hypothetical protein